MIDRAPHRTIGILRPIEAQYGMLIDRQYGAYVLGEDETTVGNIHERVEHIRSFIEEIAKCLELKTEIVECQITGDHPTDVMSGKRKKRLVGADLLAVIEPDPRTMAWAMQSMLTHPLQTLLISAADPRRQITNDRLLGALPTIPSVHRTREGMRASVRKWFSLSQGPSKNHSHDTRHPSSTHVSSEC